MADEENMTLYYNPRCTTCKKALEILKDKGYTPKVRDFTKEKLTEEEVQNILRLLDISAKDLLRTKEQLYKDLVEKEGEPDSLLKIRWIAEYPQLMQRPVLINNNKAIIARPAQKVEEIL